MLVTYAGARMRSCIRSIIAAFLRRVQSCYVTVVVTGASNAGGLSITVGSKHSTFSPDNTVNNITGVDAIFKNQSKNIYGRLIYLISNN